MHQAVVVLHGMGEQIPMETLDGFVDAVWTEDASLVPGDRPDPNTGLARTGNAAWSRPDGRLKSFELNRITTESDKNRRRTDFFEYYWAHETTGTTWEHVKDWLFDLLWRNPAKRVPKRLLHVWVALWGLTLVVIGFGIAALLPGADGPKPAWQTLANAAAGMAISWFVAEVLVARFGDVARYVKAKPENVATRQKIREGGVELLQSLHQSGTYDRIIVVAHSLGTIVAYDILAHAFAKINTELRPSTPARMKQPERHKLEDMIRAAAGLARTRAQALGEEPVPVPEPLDLEAFRRQQTHALAEAQAQGLPWRITDFITLGAPLTHAEFLMANSREDLYARQDTRVMPTCPPTLEYDGTTKLRHYAFGEGRSPEHRRLPHHAAHFALTRWTNLYSDHRAIAWGDVISGPLAEVFGLRVNGRVVRGIKDIVVLPKRDEDGTRAEGHHTPFFVHNHYWNLRSGSEDRAPDVPHHIAELRAALALLEGPPTLPPKPDP